MSYISVPDTHSSFVAFYFICYSFWTDLVRYKEDGFIFFKFCKAMMQ